MKNAPRSLRLIGLTGSIASGKSTVLAELARRGAYTLSADEFVRELYKTPAVRRWLEKKLGSCEPAQVAKRVFADPLLRQQLEKFLHPRVWRLALKKLAACPQPWAVLEVPLLFEAGWEQKTDLTVLVSASEKTLSARLTSRAITPAAYAVRRQTQLSEAEKIRRADIVLLNNGTKRTLQQKAGRLYDALTDLYVK